MALSFKLQKVLDYRSQLEEQAMQALASAKKALEREKENEASLWKELRANKLKLVDSADMLSAERWLVQNYVMATELDIKRSRDLQAMHSKEVSRCQVNLIERSKDRQLLDKLKEKQLKKQLSEQKSSEQRENDETATIRYKKNPEQIL